MLSRHTNFFDQQKLKKMSFQLVSNLSNEIETIVDVDRNIWFKRAYVRKYLDIRNMRGNYRDFPSHYTRLRSSNRALNECEMSTGNAIKPVPKDQKNKWGTFLSRRVGLYVINKCRKPTLNLINLTKCLGIELHKNKWLCKEQEALGHMLLVFNGE